MTLDPPLTDWTVGEDGLSNSSPKFLEVETHLVELINSHTHHVLRPATVDGLARLIAAQIAHIDHLAPEDDNSRVGALQKANDAFARRESAMADLLRRHGIVPLVADGIPTSLQVLGRSDPNEAKEELAVIDSVLARRTALDDFPNRASKILAAIERAAEADRFEKQWRGMLEAEHQISDAYVRIREIVGAMDTPYAPSFEQISALTESRARRLVDQLRNIRAIVTDEPSEMRLSQ